jgi:integrase
MTCYETEEPEYIEESEDIRILKQYYTSDSLKVQQGHLSIAFTLLTQTIYLMYNHTKFSELVNNSHLHQESIDFSVNMEKVIKVNEWAYSTSNTAFNVMKKLLQKTNINPNFISKLSLSKQKKIKKNSPEFCLPTKYKKQNDNDPEKMALLNFITIIKSDTKYKSQCSTRLILAYIIRFLTYHKIPFNQAENIRDVSFEDIQKSIPLIYKNKDLRIKIHYTLVFICFVMKYTEHLKDFENYKKIIHTVKQTKEDHDTHRISKKELEKMYEASKSDIKHQTIFLLMISTGIRTIGVSNIKLQNISNRVNNTLTINKSGRTIEKGNKWFTFPVSENLSKLILEYVSTQRKSNSSYLFPGRGEDIGLSPSRISAIIKRISSDAGLTGKHIHAHSIRHSFAHILLETGNKPELVSKMLGHSSTMTTEYYYLKESATEASKRMDIPWLERTEQENPVPAFLNTRKEESKKKRPSQSKKNKLLRNYAKDFGNIEKSVTPLESVEE